MIQWEVKERKEVKERAVSLAIVQTDIKPHFSEEALLLHQEILACIKDDDGKTLALDSVAGGESVTAAAKAKLHGLKEPHFLNLTTARRILSQDEFGRPLKENDCGNSAVTRLGNVFFKREPEHHLQEQAVYQLSLQLGGGIVAPSHLLIIELPGAAGAEMIAVQASLAVARNGIEDVGLDDLLRIPGGIKGLKKLFGETTFIKELPRLMSGAYYQDWIKKQSFAKKIEQFTWDEQCKFFLDRIYKLPKNAWPLEFTKDNPSRELVKRRLDDNKDLQGTLFTLLALIEQYPALRGESLSDIFFLPALFKLLHRLYPKEAMEKIVTQGENLFDYFNPENLANHLVLALLTEPEDHKGDNFRVKLQRDEKGQLLPFEMVAIDNDAAMQGIIESRKQGFELRAKSIIYALVMLMDKPMAEKVRQQLLSLNIDLTIMRWLEGLEEYHQNYNSLSKQGIIFPAMFNMQLHLHEHFREGFIERFSENLQSIQKCITKEIHLQALFLEVSPILGSYYQGLLKLYSDPQALFKVLYAAERPPLWKILQNYWSDAEINSRLQAIAKPLNAFQTFWQVLGDCLRKRSLLQADNKNQAEAIQSLIRLSRFQECQWRDKELCLLVSTFSEIFDKTKASSGFVQFFKNFEHLWLINNKERFLLTAPDILFQVMPLQKEPMFIEALLNCGANIHFIRAIDGYTPLHFAARFGYATYIPLLVKAGATLEALDNQKQSPLDKAIQYKHDEAIYQLLHHGAGHQLQPENGLFLIEHFKKRHTELCQQLLNRNQELAWQLALQNVSQKEKTPEEVFLEGIRGHLYLRSEIYAQIFSDGTFTKENIYGRHRVKPIQVTLMSGLSLGMHLKENPEFPGREIMVHHLARDLFGLITPPVSLWRFSKIEGRLWNKEPVAYPILASLTISGPNLLEALEGPDFLKNLNRQSFSESVVLAMLINPEDGRGDNYIVQDNRIISIDNDRSFVRPVALKSNGEEIEGPKGLQVKSILYCLDLMQETIHPDVRERLLNINAFNFLKEWLEHLQQEQSRIQKLFSDKDRKKLFENNIQLDILFKPSVIADIYQKLMRLQNTLRRHPEMSLLQILRRVIPELGLRYSAAFEAHDTSLKRFTFLTEGCFEVQQIKVQNKTQEYDKSVAMTSARMVELTCDKRLEAKHLEEEKNATLEIALARLKQIEKQYSELKDIQQELLQGKPKRFKQLISDQQEMIINGRGADLPGIDFVAIKKPDGSLDVKRQQEIWKIMQQVSFKKLRIINHEALTDEMLNQFLKPMKSLLALEILGCPKVTDKTLSFIAFYCPALEKLRLERLPLLQNGINFPGLRTLVVQDCQNLKMWPHQGTLVKHLEFQYCRQLSTIHIANSSNLKKLLLNGCPVPHGVFYEKYPVLFEFSLENLPEHFIQSLDKTLTRSVISRNHEIPRLAIDTLMEMIEIWKRCFRKSTLKLLEKLEYKVIKTVVETLIKLSPTPEILKDIVDALLPLLKDEDWEIRRSAAATLGELSFSPETLKIVIDALLPLLRDKVFLVRGSAAYALGQLSPTPGMLYIVINALLVILKLKHENLAVTEVAAEALGKLSPPPEMVKDVIDALLPLVKHENISLASTVAKALWKLSPSSEMLMVVLDAMLLIIKNNDIGCHKAIETLGILFSQPKMSKVILDTLLPLLKDENLNLRRTAAFILSRLSLPSEIVKNVIDVLLLCLEDRDQQIRCIAVDTLGELSPPLNMFQIVLDALLLCLRHGTRQLGCSVVRTLGKLSPPPEMLQVVLDALLTFLVDEDEDVRKEATYALEKLSFLPGMLELVINILLPLLKDGNSSVRNAAAEVLGKLSSSPKTLKIIIVALLPLLKDGDSSVRSAVAEALGNLSPTPEMLKVVLSSLLSLLKDRNSHVINVAAGALVKLPHTPETLKIIMDVFFSELDKAVSLEDKVSIVISLAELCQVERFMICFSTWFENTFPIPSKPFPLKSHFSLVDSNETSETDAVQQFSLSSSQSQQLQNFENSVHQNKKDDFGVPHSVFYEKYPFLFGSSLEDLPEHFVQALDKMLAKNVVGIGYDVPRPAIDTLMEMIEVWQRCFKKSILKLLARLEDKNLTVRIDAAEKLMKLSYTPHILKNILDALLPFLKDKDLNVRKSAAKALWKLSLPIEMLKVIVDTLLSSLKDKDWDVRRSAVTILGELLPSSGLLKIVLDVMVALLKDENSDVRYAVTETLGKLSIPQEMLKYVINSLVPFLNDRDSYIIGYAAETLGRISLPTEMLKDVVDALLPLLKNEYSWIRRAAARALGKLSPSLKDEWSNVKKYAAEVLGKLSIPQERLKDVIDALLPLLKDEDSYVRITVAEELGKLSVHPEILKSAIDALLPLLEDEDSYVTVAEVLGKLSIPQDMLKELIDNLVQLLKYENSYVRYAAAEVLGQLSTPPEILEDVINGLLPRLKDVDLDVRAATVEALGKLSIPPEMLKDVIIALVWLLKNEDLRDEDEELDENKKSNVRIATAEALGKLSIPPEMLKAAIDTLVLLLKDEDLLVRYVATEALRKLSIPTEMLKIVIDTLVSLLEDEPSFVRITVAEVLGKLSVHPELLKSVIDALLPLLKDKLSFVRITVAEALGKLSVHPEVLKSVIETLLPLLKDKDRNVRVAAAEALGRLPHTPATIKMIMGTFFLELNKSVSFQDKDYVTSILTSLAALCQVDRYMGFFATWFENTFPKIIQDSSQIPISSASSVSLRLTNLKSLSSSHGYQNLSHTNDSMPMSGSPHSPGDSKEASEIYLLPQFTLATTPKQNQRLQGVSVASQKTIQKQEVAKDEKAICEWRRLAEEQGHAAAQYDLGVAYANGQGVVKDEKIACEWFQKAADQGYAMAQNALGVMYVKGLGVAKDEKIASEWYRRAAEQAHVNAQYNLGAAYANGQGVVKDEKIACEWYRKAAEQGCLGAQNNLGVMYENGRGVVKSEKIACEWYRKAAEQGHATAQYNLGVAYANGRGVAKDKKTATEWYRKAAAQGDEKAKQQLELIVKEEAARSSSSLAFASVQNVSSVPRLLHQ